MLKKRRSHYKCVSVNHGPFMAMSRIWSVWWRSLLSLIDLDDKYCMTNNHTQWEMMNALNMPSPLDGLCSNEHDIVWWSLKRTWSLEKVATLWVAHPQHILSSHACSCTSMLATLTSLLWRFEIIIFFYLLRFILI